jgi:hypothetical protein
MNAFEIDIIEWLKRDETQSVLTQDMALVACPPS